MDEIVRIENGQLFVEWDAYWSSADIMFFISRNNK